MDGTPRNRAAVKLIRKKRVKQIAGHNMVSPPQLFHRQRRTEKQTSSQINHHHTATRTVFPLSLSRKGLASWSLSLSLLSFSPGRTSSLQSSTPRIRKFLKPSPQTLAFPSCFSLLKIPVLSLSLSLSSYHRFSPESLRFRIFPRYVPAQMQVDSRLPCDCA